MKAWILAAALLAPAIAAAEEKIAWGDDYKKGLEQAQKEKKPLLLYFWASWCEGCKQLDEGAFSDARVLEQAKRYVCVRIDVDKDEETTKKYDVHVTPDVRFTRSSGEEIAAMEDPDPEAMAAQMKKVADEYKE